MTSPKKQKAIANRRSVPEVGQRGNKRGKEAQARRARVRQANPRYQSAMAERDAAEKRLEQLKGGHTPQQYIGITREIMARFQTPEVVVAEPESVPETPAPKPRKPKTLEAAALPSMDIPTIDAKAEGTDWSLGQARSMLRSGYRIDHVIRVTGWGPDWFDDLPLDDDGYGLDPYE